MEESNDNQLNGSASSGSCQSSQPAAPTQPTAPQPATYDAGAVAQSEPYQGAALSSTYGQPAAGSAQQSSSYPPPTASQPVYQYQASGKPHSHRKLAKTSVKTFFAGFLGAVLACVLVLGLTGNLFRSGSSSTVIGNSNGSTINVSDDSTTLAEAVSDKVLPSVVCIYVYTTGSSGSGYYNSGNSSSQTLSALGSGVILSGDGYILTNYHVIEGESSLKVSIDGETVDATVTGTDATSDLAVIKVNKTGLTPIDIGSSADLKTGEWVMAVGSPYGMEQSVSTGIVSATSRSSASLQSTSSSAVYANMIQTDAAINPGNSGGALVDSNGKLIGINTLIASYSSTNSGVGFAIPVDYAINIAQQIMAGKTPAHSQLGVSLVTVNSSTAQRYGLSATSGAYVSSVSSGTGAANAGIQVGDIITKVNGTSVSSATDVILAVRSHNAGDTVTVEVNRDGSTQTMAVTLGSDDGTSTMSSYEQSTTGGAYDVESDDADAEAQDQAA